MTLWSAICLCGILSAGGAAAALLNGEFMLNILPNVMAGDSQQTDDDGHASNSRNPLSPVSSEFDERKSDSAAVDVGLLPVKVFRLDSIQPAVQVQTYSGIVMARRTSRLAAKHLGRITKLLADLGDSVKAGQVLAELDQRELEAEKKVLEAQLTGAQAKLDELQKGPRKQEVEQAEALVRQFQATLTLRQANLRRTETLMKSASISRQEYDEALTSLEATEAQLQSARKTLELMREGTREEQIRSQDAVVGGLMAQLDKIEVLISELTITSPYDGHVQSRLVDEGVVVSPGEPIFEIAETGHLEVRVGLPAHLVSSGVLTNARVMCGKQHLPAELVRVSPNIDHRTRNLEAVFSVQARTVSDSANGYASRDAECRVGQAVDVQLNVQSDQSGWWIPSSALVPATRGLWSVLVVKPPRPADEDANAESVGTESSISDSSDEINSKTDGSESIVSQMQVELLRSSGDWSQVRGTLTGSELLIPNGVHRITSGQKVLAMIAGLTELGSIENAIRESE